MGYSKSLHSIVNSQFVMRFFLTQSISLLIEYLHKENQFISQDINANFIEIFLLRNKNSCTDTDANGFCCSCCDFI